MQQVGQRPRRARRRQAPRVERSHGVPQSGHGLHGEQRRERAVTVNEAVRLQLQHQIDRPQKSLRRALGHEGRPQVGHEGVAHHQEVVLAVLNEERVGRLAAGRRNDAQVEAPFGQRLGGGDQPVGRDVELHGAGAEEVLEGRLVAARAGELLGEAGPGDDRGPRLADGGQAPHVVPVAVGEDDVLDRRVRHLAQRRHRLARALFGGAAVDGDDHLGRNEEHQVREVVALGDVDALGLANQALLAEAKSVRRIDRQVPEHPRRGGIVERAEARPRQHLR